MTATREEEPCEAARDGMPHLGHGYKAEPDDPPDRWWCPGHARQ